MIGVDLAKSVFQMAVADATWTVRESHRLTRSQFDRWFLNRAVGLVVMKACGRDRAARAHAPPGRNSFATVTSRWMVRMSSSRMRRAVA